MQHSPNPFTKPPSGGPRRPIWRVAVKPIFFGVLVCSAALLVIWWRQENLLFYPVQLNASYALTSEADVHEHELLTI